MAKFEVSTLINRPVEEVFEFVSNVENNKKWQAGVTDVKITSKDPIGVGLTYKYDYKLLGKVLDLPGEYIEFIPNKSFTFQGTGGPFPFKGIVNFEANNGSTKITQEMEATKIGGFFKLAESVIIKQTKKQFEDDFRKLKSILENQS